MKEGHRVEEAHALGGNEDWAAAIDALVGEETQHGVALSVRRVLDLRDEARCLALCELAPHQDVAARDRGRFGFVVGGVLVPEVVEFEGLAVGRFEVTQAQFAAFQHSAPITDPNFPAHGISYEQAVAYCSWLSAKTGERYRLPNAEDAAKLYKETMAGSNTLDRWAGYSVGPEDAAKLAELVEAFGAESLLLPVGSTRGCGKAAVFDLGGNVAEWCSTPDGGVALGGSADRPSDPKSPSQPRPEFIGFRVVRA